MKKLIAVLLLFTFYTIPEGRSAVQTYTFSQSCNSTSWLTANNPGTECNYDNIDFMGQIFNLVLVNKSVETDMNNIVISGNRYFFLGDPTNQIEFLPDLMEGDVVDGSQTFGPLANFEYWQHEEGVPWPSDPLWYTVLMTEYIGLAFNVGNDIHFGWLKFSYAPIFGNDIVLEELAIENIPNFPIQVNGQSSIFNGPYNVSGRSFVDSNSDGLFNVGEPTIGSCSFDISNSAVNFTDYNVSSPYSLNLEENTYDLSINYDADIWTPTNSTSNSFTLNSSNPTVSNLDFGFTANGVVESLIGNISPQSARCNEIRSHVISVQNNGNIESSGYAAYEIDDLCSFTGSNGTDSIVGNIAYFSWNDLGFGSSTYFYLDLQMPSTAFLGEQLNFSLDLYNSSGTYLGGNSLSLEVTCAYDPNDKTEFNGYTENGFILPGDELEYLIRFQNTGNDTAYNVFLLDELSPLLDWDSFEAQSTSHAYESFILEDGRLYVGFDEIYLPDSTTNEPASNGFFKFTINALDGLPPWTLIENTTEIYFDFNPAVITNTTVNTIFDCQGIATFDGPESLCFGEDYLATTDQEFIESYSWTLDGNELSTENTLTINEIPIGIHWITLTTENPLCTVTDSMMVTVNDLPIVDIQQDDGTLIALAFAMGPYQWYFDGVLIDGATSASFTPTSTGTYIVTVVGIGDCIGTSEELFFTYIGLEELSQLSFSISPNPFVEQFIVHFQNWNGEKLSLEMTDHSGRKVRNINVNGNEILIKREDLSAGIYFLNLKTTKGHILESEKLILK